MSTINSSFHSIAEQVLTNNQQVVEILSNINSLTQTTDPAVTLNILNAQGVPVTVSYPSFTYLKAEIDRLNNNINSLYGLNNNGATVQVSSSNIFKKVITVDLNLEPKDIPSISAPTTFVSQANYLFDNLLNPELFIQVNLTGLITVDVRKIRSRRYIVSFEKDSKGAFTSNGQAGLNSFNNTFKGQSNINQDDFLLWHKSTPGVLMPLNPVFDEDTFDLTPNELQYNGIFSVLKIQEDSLNNKLWYYIDTLTYTEIQNNKPKQLKIGDSLIINVDNSNSIYEITEISNSASNPMIRLIRSDGNQPVPVGVGTLKIYSPILNNPNVRISVGYNERNVVFIKALNTTNHLLSKNWSKGIGYFTNDLKLNSSDSYNGQSLDKYYTNVVYDYGLALKDLVVKKIPNVLGILPSPPTLDAANFKIVQTNKHLTDTPDSNLLKNHAAQVNSINSELKQLSSAIQSKNTQLKVTRFTTNADRAQFSNDVVALQQQHDSKSSLKSSINTQILNMSALPQTTIQPTFSIRGFWTIPAPSVTANTYPQQIVKFDIQYRRLSKDGSETPVQTFKLVDTAINANKFVASPLTVNAASKVASNGVSVANVSANSAISSASANVSVATANTAAYSNWIALPSLAKKQTLDKSTGLYSWVSEDMNSPDSININQLDIPIQPNETIEIRMRSISEVGYPDSPVESDWSNIVTIVFPDNLSSVTNQNSLIVANAHQEQVKTTLITELNNQGLSAHLADSIVVQQKTYFHSGETILSGFKDKNGVAVDLKTHIQSLMDRISTLEAVIAQSKGELVITILRSSETYTVKNNSELNFTVDCEDYLEPLSGAGIPTGRVFSNRIYKVNDFVMKISNASNTNSLGLLSSRTYTSGTTTDVYNGAVPQVFWVDDQDQLITSDITGQSKTQLDNQFLWAVNYDSIDLTTVTKLSDNIGNLFSVSGNNSITDILSSTEFNAGYSDPSVLSFVGSNNSLIDSDKWIDTTTSVASVNKLLTTIHPSTPQLNDIVETNSQKVHNLYGGANNDINIPINIYFKMNSLDSSRTGANYQYINLNGVTQNVRHIKKVKFLLDNQIDSRPFVFTLVFTINRVNSISKKNLATSPSQLVSNSFNIARA
jgi:hypothetical protein